MTGITPQDTDIRLKAFEFLERQRLLHGDLLPVPVLRGGFDYQGTRVPLMAPKGIHKPRLMDMPLSITTVPPTERHERPYDDQIQEGGLLYRAGLRCRSCVVDSTVLHPCVQRTDVR